MKIEINNMVSLYAVTYQFRCYVEGQHRETKKYKVNIACSSYSEIQSLATRHCNEILTKKLDRRQQSIQFDDVIEIDKMDDCFI